MKISKIFIFILILILSVASINASEVKIDATTIQKVLIKELPSDSSRTIVEVPKESVVNIYYIDEDWAYIKYNKYIGYAKANQFKAVVNNDSIGIKSVQASTYDKADTKTDEIKEANDYVVDLTQWDEAKKIFKVGEPAKVYDIYTKKIYYVKSFSNGKHADVEPVTKDDTNIMFETYNKKWSWDVRPVWVTIGGKTMAASINGMPHGKGVNDNNGMDGQICIHFKGSTTHNGNKAFAKLHQDVLMEAYELSKK